MSFFNIVFNLIIEPLKLIFETIFSIANGFFTNPGYAIVFLSLAMNFLVLPLYKRADEMQNEQRQIENKVRPIAQHIKKCFKGDERFMMLQTHYRQNNYNPMGVLKGSVSLLLQIPFFIAAYQMLSNLQLLNGVKFGLISDLSHPDALISIYGVSINLLPILMTVINIVSGIIYTKGMPVSSKIQLYGMAGVFLVLLYNSPSGLVFYWTLNNVFSLLKNIFYKFRNPKKLLHIISSIVGAILLVLSIIKPPIIGYKEDKYVIIYGFILLLELPLINSLINKYSKINLFKNVKVPAVNNTTFFWAGLVLSVLTGLLIPSNVIKSSPEEFINLGTLQNPLIYLVSSFSIAIGVFVIWMGIFHSLSTEKGKRIQEAFMFALIIVALINYFALEGYNGLLSPLLTYNFFMHDDATIYICTALITVCFMSIAYIIWRIKNNAIKPVCTIVAIALLVASSVNMYGINKVVQPKIESLKQSSQSEDIATIPLSQNGKNVIVLMMDKAISTYVPFIFNENPKIAKQFEGFTFYPNTISFGGSTNYGSPGLYGGYEYMPKESNKRPNESLESKQNEALKVLPVLFDNEGYNVTVCDPTYAGYDWIPDLSIYDDYESIKTYNTYGKFGDKKASSKAMNHALMRNFFCFSIFKISPQFLKSIIYDDGSYNDPGVILTQKVKSTYTAEGISNDFVNAYEVLKNLPKITKIDKTTKSNNFLMMSNDTAHNTMMLQEPECEPSYRVDNTKYYQNQDERFSLNGVDIRFTQPFQVAHYECNVASWTQLGIWFDYLRQNGVYDNTKIIIVSDHGFPLFQREDMYLNNRYDIMQYNALLMVKDFNSNEFKTDYTFMTNADTPTLATEDLIENPINPFTKKPINSDMKTSGLNYVHTGSSWNVDINNGNTFEPNKWITVKDNVFDISQWHEVK